MTPATKARSAKADALAQLDALEKELADATAEAGVLATEHYARVCKLHGRRGVDQGGLADDLNRLRYRDPAAFNPDGSPVDADSPAGQLAAEVDGLQSGLDELAQRVDHARQVERRRREDVEGHVREHFDAIVEALRPMAEQVAAETAEAAQVFAAQLGRYIEHYGRLHSLAALAQRPGDPSLARRIQGEFAGQFKQTIEAVEFPAPTFPA